VPGVVAPVLPVPDVPEPGAPPCGVAGAVPAGSVWTAWALQLKDCAPLPPGVCVHRTMRLLAVSIYHTELLLPDDVPPLVPNSGMYCACPLVEGVRAGVWAEAITAGMARLAARIPRAFMTIS
jgi:hypothetical protein